jgi:hypothetical protein
MSDVQRTGRICTHIFDQYSPASSYICLTIPNPLLFDFMENFLPESRLDGQVQETRVDDFHTIKNLIPLRKVLQDDLCDIVGRFLLGRC